MSVQNLFLPFGSGSVWDRGRAELVEPVIKKGSFNLLYNRAILVGASFCYSTVAMVREEWKGKRIRAYGTDVPLFAPWGGVGVIGVELLEP